MKQIFIFVIIIQSFFIYIDNKKIKDFKKPKTRHLEKTKKTVKDFNFESDITQSFIPLSFHGFGGFKTLYNNSTFTWNTYFKYYNGLKPKIVSYFVYIVINKRKSQEKTITKNINCSLILDLNNFLQYYCNLELYNNITLSNITKISMKPLFTFDGRFITNLDIDNQTNTEIYNIMEQENYKNETLISGDSNILFFGSGTIDLDINEGTFYINKLKIVGDNKLFVDKKITGNYIFLFFNEHISKNKKENVSCTLIKNTDKKTYDLKCKPNIPFITHINDGRGYLTTNDNKNNVMIIEIENDYIQLEDYNITNGTSKYNEKSNDNKKLYSNGTLETNGKSKTNGIKNYSSSPTNQAIEYNNYLLLYSFGAFKSIENTREISWKIYFRYFSGKKPKIISHPIIISINIRKLQEKNFTKNADCLFISELSDYLQYECKKKLDNNITFSSIEKILMDPVFTSEKVYYGNLDVYGQGSTKLFDIMEQKDDKYKVLLSENINLLIFDSGNINIVKDEEKFYVNKLIISSNKNNLRKINKDITGNYKFLFFNENIIKNKSETISCLISKNIDGETYDLECKPSIPFTTHINNARGYGDDEKNKNNIVFLNVKKDYIILDRFLYINNGDYQKKKSSGISNGDLSAIIITGISILIAIFILIIIIITKCKSKINLQQNIQPTNKQGDISKKNLNLKVI